MDAAPAHDEHAAQLRTYLRWLLVARLLILSCFLGAILVLHALSSDSRYVVSTAGLLGAIAVTYAVSIGSALLLPRVRGVEAFAYAQIVIDLLLTTGAIVLTGGADSPFPFLYSLAIFNAAILLYARGAAIAAILAGFGYTALVLALAGWGLLEGSYPIPQPALDSQLVARLLITNASFFIVAYLAALLTQRLRDTERLLEAQRSEGDRLTRLQEALAQHIGCGLVTTDIDGRITSANHLAAAFINNDQAAPIGQDVGTVFPPLHLTAEGRSAFLQSTSPTAATEFQHAGPGGTRLLLRCSATAVRDTYHHPVGVLYILQDVTLLHQLEQRYQQEGEAALDAVSDIVAGEDDDAPALDGFVGRSATMQHLRAVIDKVAPSDATVLLRGDSGTGKEIAARAIHAKSPRRNAPFVAINCGAIPEHLIESELFGHVKGAFTGAVSNRPGFFRTADGGTVFLDEIGELPAPLQVKLLRVLQERVFKPVGGETNVAVNVRVIAATNKDLDHEVQTGSFREDLFYRLNVISIDLPPLRQRRDDIPPLIRHFLRMFSDLHRKRVTRLSVGAARRLLDYPYPGNIRELANLIEHAVTMAEGETVREDDLPAYILHPAQAPASPAKPAPPRQPEADDVAASSGTGPINGHDAPVTNLEQHLEEYEKAILLRALRDSHGVKKRAAELLGINYRSFRHRLSKYGLGADIPD